MDSTITSHICPIDINCVNFHSLGVATVDSPFVQAPTFFACVRACVRACVCVF